MKPLLPIIAALGILTTTACGSSSDKTDTTTEDIEIEKRDSAIYRLGRAHAQRMLEQCATTDMIRSELLDIRAREALIRSRMYPEAAQAYIQGFRHYIQESGTRLQTRFLALKRRKSSTILLCWSSPKRISP